VRRAGSGLSSLGRAACLALAVFAVFLTFREVELDRVVGILSRLAPPAFALLLLPQLLALAAESAAWRRAFAAITRAPRFRSLLRVRLETEALAQTLPGGVLIAESIKPYLLGRHCGLALEAAITGVAARKYLLLTAHALYIVLAALFGFEGLRRVSPRLLGAAGLEWLVLASGLGVGLTAAVFCLLLARGRVGGRLRTVLSRLPIPSFRRAVAQRAEAFHATDLELARFFAVERRRLVAPLLGFLCAWLLESVETFLILRLLGADLSFSTVASFEVAVSLLRNLAFVLPAGLGIQDVGYALFLRALGVADPLHVSAAFCLLKRGKELVWAAVGYALLAWDLRGGAPEPAWTV
jgi:uncharacterized protein (TIRG00374 family)